MPRTMPSQLRDDIDSGRTGDKVPYGDPAAAPLGTDDEAAGRPPSGEATARAVAAETRGPHSLDAPSVTEERSRPDLSSSAPRGVRPLLVVLVCAALATLAAALLIL